jgi:hypothetical protein
MSTFDTIMICEGEREPPGETEEEKQAAYFAAWQELIDSGLCWQLQGWFGRMAVGFIEAGHCTPPEDFKPPTNHPSDR